MHYENVGGTSARSPPPRESPRFRAPASPKDDLIKPPPNQQNAKGENTYARGGHGIFGQPRVSSHKKFVCRYVKKVLNIVLDFRSCQNGTIVFYNSRKMITCKSIAQSLQDSVIFTVLSSRLLCHLHIFINLCMII